MGTTVTIPARFNGPPESGNGGYSCGILAAFIDGAARVRLHVPPPLATPLEVRDIGQGGIGMFDGETKVGTAYPARFDLDVPPPPPQELARAALSGFPCYHNHIFPTCFVCGPGRPGHDGLELFTGPVADRELLASPWTPAPDLLDSAGNVRPEIVWAALDCPGYFACMLGEIRPAVLGELQAQLHSPVPGGGPLVVYSWPLGEEGRKCYAGSAIADGDGRVFARARSTWILLRA